MANFKYKVKLRDNFCCQVCGSVADLTIHHINKNKKSNRNSLDNLITLCRHCHDEYHVKYPTGVLKSFCKWREQKMSYRHISNLYANRDVMHFKRCIAMEKINGTSAHVSYSTKSDALSFFSGGSKHQQFVSLFDQEKLLSVFRQNAAEFPDTESVTIYGEAYGGRVQKMADTYGPNLKFIAFEVCFNGNNWQGVRAANMFVEKFGLEFVYWEEIDCTEEAINAAMMADSVQAIRNGMGPGHMREGVVLRPVIELIHPNGGRIIAKHKRPEFAERATTPSFTDPEKLKVLKEADEISKEWVNSVRLAHVLDALGLTEPRIEDANKIIAGMVEDVYRESKGEIVQGPGVKKAIGKETMRHLKLFLQNQGA